MVSDELRAEITSGVLRVIASAVLHNHVVTQRMGLGASDSQFLTLLDLHGPLTPGRLAELTNLSTGTVTGVIDRLEKVGFVHRTRDSADRRKVLVTRAPDALISMAPHYREHLAAVLRDRDDDDLRVIAAVLTDLVSNDR